MQTRFGTKGRRTAGKLGLTDEEMFKFAVFSMVDIDTSATWGAGTSPTC